jgi:hypothetical protein
MAAILLAFQRIATAKFFRWQPEPVLAIPIWHRVDTLCWLVRGPA